MGFADTDVAHQQQPAIDGREIVRQAKRKV
jgi:hypothetical protein